MCNIFCSRFSLCSEVSCVHFEWSALSELYMSDYYPLSFHIEKSRLETCRSQIWIAKLADYECLLTPGLLTTANFWASPSCSNQHFRDTIFRAARNIYNKVILRDLVALLMVGRRAPWCLSAVCVGLYVKKPNFSKLFAVVYLMKR
jgi:hypothetical protein